VLSLGAVFAIFAGWYYWFPKMFGYMYPEWLGKLHFWLTFIGVNLTFFPQHFLGLARHAAPLRRLSGCLCGLELRVLDRAYISLAGVVIFFIVIIQAFARKQKAADNPWGAGATTLEWTVSSPPPFHTFDRLPQVK
jgi:cytochrome c oxidase subunit 1